MEDEPTTDHKHLPFKCMQELDEFLESSSLWSMSDSDTSGAMGNDANDAGKVLGISKSRRGPSVTGEVCSEKERTMKDGKRLAQLTSVSYWTKMLNFEELEKNDHKATNNENKHGDTDLEHSGVFASGKSDIFAESFVSSETLLSDASAHRMSMLGA